MTTLITGATGFIGRRLINAVDGEIRVLSRSGHSDLETVICDLQSSIISDNALVSIDTVFHLAGFTHDMRDPSKIEDLYYKVNVSATVQLAELAVRAGVKRFVFVSSVKAGGVSTSKKCINENDQIDPEGIYGKTKREAELRLLKIGKESGMHVSIIRPTLVYGPEVKGNLKSMLLGIEKGWFPPLPETGNKRSLIHVDDLVRAILLVADDNRANGEIFIATDGAPHSSREIYNAICGVIGKSIPRWGVPRIMFDIAGLVGPRIKYKINKLLGDECYSSVKLEELGFKAKKSLKDMNETDF
ncbi:NAD-dependent epimerase/dehydratase family protein [Candidatus Pseudothioglobus singularis]|nr:NAD-dependent epimerase/dehydratase family protein [Candidatus Pseudothioglobus singularis]